MTTRRALGALLLLAGCGQDGVTNHLGGFGDPIRGAALWAPRNLSDTSRLAGRPAAAALAAAQLELLVNGFTDDPRWSVAVSPTAAMQVRAGRDEMRQAIGIPPDAPGPAVEAALRQAASRIRAGLGEDAFAADPAIFPLGPRRTMERISDLPFLPQVRLAAGAAATEADRLERRL